LRIFLFLTLFSFLFAQPTIIQKPILFTKERINLTKEYIKKHYGLNVKNIEITPKIIVLHWTAILDFPCCFHLLEDEKLNTQRAYINRASHLNVSAHYLVNRDGTIYQLMPDNWMARHVIGLNYSSIGIENVGGDCNKKEDLTLKQVKANVELIRYLKKKYPTIEYLIGHYEYLKMKNTPLWLEKDPKYKTYKKDPGEKFMHDVRERVKDLGLKKP